MVAVNNLPPTVWAFFCIKNQAFKSWNISTPSTWMRDTRPLYAFIFPLHAFTFLIFLISLYMLLYSFTVALRSVSIPFEFLRIPFILLLYSFTDIPFTFLLYSVYPLYIPFTIFHIPFILLLHSLHIPLYFLHIHSISPLDSLCIFSYPRLANEFSNFDIQNNEIPKVIQWLFIVWGHKLWKS